MGTSYRHCLIWENGEVEDLTAPHDVLGREIGPYLPSDRKLYEMMDRSYEILKDHPLNVGAQKGRAESGQLLLVLGSGNPSRSSFLP